jgi:hypothetical protein
MISLIKTINNSKLGVNQAIDDICNKYVLKPNIPWLFPIVNWEGNDEESLLGNYSETRNIQSFNDYGRTKDYVYLYNKINWTDGNILLDTYRNDLLKEMLKQIDGLTFSNEWFIIQNEFFRGWDLKPFVEKSDIKLQFEITRTEISVGVKRISNLEEMFDGVDFSDCDQPDGWFFQKKYSFENIVQTEIIELIEKINQEMFDPSNKESKLYKLLNK